VPSPKVLGRNGIASLQVDEKIRVLSEQRHLAGRVTSVGAVSVGVDQFGDGRSICLFTQRQIGVVTAA